MRVNYYVEGKIKEMDFIPDETLCPICGQPTEVNPFKKEPKHPDYKCSNKTKGTDGKWECGAGFWKPTPRQPAHQLKPTPVNTGTQILLSNILETLKQIEKNTNSPTLPMFNE